MDFKYLGCLKGLNKGNLKEMFQEQYKLNNKTAGDMWVLGETKEGCVINWSRCMFMETAELIDSFPWKHWKSIDAEPDYLNAQVEVADIWHFFLSAVMERSVRTRLMLTKSDEEMANLTAKDIKNAWDELEDGVVTVILDMLLTSYGKANMEQRKTVITASYLGKRNHNTLIMIKELEHLMSDAISFNIENTLSTEEFSYYMANILYALANFSTFIEGFDIVKVYRGKAILNKFRQDHGYKEGTYKKLWNYEGKELEDNKVAFALLAKGTDLDSLYEELERVYK